MIEKKSARRHSESKNSAEKTGRATFAEMHPCHIRETFDSMADTLNRTLGSNISLTVNTQAGLPQIYGDPHMLETLLFNLAVNAKEAMPGGGELNLSAQVSEVDTTQAAEHANARPGRFVRLAVADTGCGISADTLPHIFDTSFTTKSSGQKSGLGLAAVRGIVKQHNGWIETQSELGKGTIFRIYLPALETSKAPNKPRAAEKPGLTGNSSANVANPAGETILIVEDEPDLRDLVTQLLETRGYKVISAPTGAAALKQWAAHKDKIQLVLTDMVMPDGMTGKALAETIQAEAPNLPIIFSSGHVPGGHRSHIGDIDLERFLGKPYRPAQLFEIVERCLRSVPAAA